VLSATAQVARESLMARCMNARGFPYAALPLGVDDPTSPTDDQRQVVREWRATSESYRSMPGYRNVEEGESGCIGQAATEMYPDLAGRSDVLLSQVQAASDVFRRVYTDEAYLSELGELASCLSAQGYAVDATLADPEQTAEQISAVAVAVAAEAEPVDETQFEFVPELFEALDAPMTAICPTYHRVVRDSFYAAQRRAEDAWASEYPERLAPVLAVMLEEYRRVLRLVSDRDITVGTVFVGEQMIEVVTRDQGAGLCARFTPELIAGCDSVDPTAPTQQSRVTFDDGTEIAYGFMSAGWSAWVDTDGVRTDVVVAPPDPDGRVAFAALVASDSTVISRPGDDSE
jgi:hypothetical protein